MSYVSSSEFSGFNDFLAHRAAEKQKSISQSLQNPELAELRGADGPNATKQSFRMAERANDPRPELFASLGFLIQILD